jgi:hypothetical protein
MTWWKTVAVLTSLLGLWTNNGQLGMSPPKPYLSCKLTRPH